MAKKKKELTKEEILNKEREQGIFLIKEEVKHLNEPTYRFNIGDKVRFGALKESTVKEVLYDGKVYVLHCIATNNNYGNPYDYEKIIVAPWVEVRPLDCGDTNFTKNNDVKLFFNNSSVDDLIRKYYHFGINMDPHYQRGLVWTNEDKEYLLDSVFNNIDIGKFVLIYLEDDEWKKTGYGYEILDGKQRLNTLIEFYENRIKYKGRYYNELSKKDKATFKNLNISVAEVKDTDEVSILKYFIMLNTTGKGVDIKHIEKIKKILKEN